jgi:hypothetical protein
MLDCPFAQVLQCCIIYQVQKYGSLLCLLTIHSNAIYEFISTFSPINATLPNSWYHLRHPYSMRVPISFIQSILANCFALIIAQPTNAMLLLSKLMLLLKNHIFLLTDIISGTQDNIEIVHLSIRRPLGYPCLQHVKNKFPSKLQCIVPCSLQNAQLQISVALGHRKTCDNFMELLIR